MWPGCGCNNSKDARFVFFRTCSLNFSSFSNCSLWFFSSCSISFWCFMASCRHGDAVNPSDEPAIKENKITFFSLNPVNFQQRLTRFLSSRNFLVLLLFSSRTRRSRSALFLMLLSWLMALLFSMDILAWLARISLLCLQLQELFLQSIFFALSIFSLYLLAFHQLISGH